jgi:hypothetical protein
VDTDSLLDCNDTCIDIDDDGYGSAGGAGNTCIDTDCNDGIATCNTDCDTDLDTDALIDCNDSCLDADGDGYGNGGGAGNTCIDTDCNDADSRSSSLRARNR